MLTGPEDKGFIATYSSVRRGATFGTGDQLQPIDLKQFLNADAPDFIGMADAVRAATTIFEPDPALRERRILIVIPGDGEDLSDYSQALSAAQRAGVKVFIFEWRVSSIGIGKTPFVFPSGSPFQLDFSLATGGWVPTLQGNLWFERLKLKIDSMYSLTYVPSEPYRSGKLRTLNLKITTSKRWRVFAPKRYLMASAP